MRRPPRFPTVGSLLAALVLLLSLPGVAAAQLAIQSAPSAETLVLELNQGTLLRLPAPAANIFIGNADIAEVQTLSATMVSLVGKAPGETVMYVVGDNDRVLINRRVLVSHNLGELNRMIRDMIPGAQIQARSVQGGILLTGSVAAPEDAEDARRLAARFVPDERLVMNRLAIRGATQVHLRVRIAEVSKDVTKRFGINWETFGLIGSGGGLGIARGIDLLFDEDTGALVRPAGTDVLLGQINNSRLNLNILVDALADEGLVTLLAEPSLTAKNGETASFLAGGEFPVPLANGVGDVDVEFKEYGVSLAFTPTLIGPDRIGLRVRPEVSQLSDAGAIQLGDLVIPALTTRRAETTLELGSGQSFVIGGLLQSGGNQTISKFPFLGDLPVLGPLFRSSAFNRNESELVIIVTPYLVEPSSTRLALPTDGVRLPDDAERILQGRTIDRSSGPDGSTSRGATDPAMLAQASPRAPVGFIVE